MNYKLIAAGALLGSTAILGSAFAHESRVLPADKNSVRLTVGFHVEPAFEDSFNAIDVILYTYDKACPLDKTDFYGNVIDTGGTKGNADPDTVNLKVDALYLNSQTPPTGPNGNIAPPGIIKSLTITNYSPLTEAYGDAGTYNSWLRPTHPGNTAKGGAYGFHVYGTVHAGPSSYKCEGDSAETPIAARTAKIDAYYVCGNGSFTPPHSFGCISAIQPFPGLNTDSYTPNTSYYTH
ncbi:hypothetical protein [Methylocapsa palsarum]|uniref:Spondin_N n=1 Tax=Methylocapsa palsarum TaxID=1612308 RepID=A0A1I4AQU3_9HYPH|nr:hypothetical protein [Methylocapsa palsarum]SFK58089.1 hypothetical protein SAMN05444581_11120 [Methylocapsa palsarum]